MAILDSYSEANYSLDEPILSLLDTDAFGQSFTGNGGVLTSVQWYLKKIGAPTENLRAKIYAHTGTFGTSSRPTGVALATSAVIAASALSSSFVLEDFTFSGIGQITLVNGTRYVATLEGPITDAAATDYVVAGSDNTSPTHAGNESQRVQSSQVWSAASSKDMIFYVNGILPELPYRPRILGSSQAVKRASFY